MNKAAITLLVVTSLLVTIGIVMLFSTSAVQARQGDPNFYLKRQIAWLVIGGVLSAVAAAMPYQKFRGWCLPILAIGAVLLIVVLVPHVGITVKGARRWLGVGSIRVQPSEFAKLALVVFLAHYLAKEKRRIDQLKRGFLVPMGIVGAMCLLVLAEPDFGTTALMASVALAMMFIAGVRLRYLVPTVLSGLTGFAALVMHNPLRMKRMLAFGSGGVNGLGLGNSRQKMFYLPEAHTDFIFPIVGEELGLIGTLGVLLLFAALVACGVIISLRTSDLFGQYLGLGTTLLLALQTLINVGVVTAWLPTKGLALPFLSYGGSNVVMNLVAVGILLSIYRHGAEARTDAQEFFAQREPVT
jgi:cell division protein FtsW